MRITKRVAVTTTVIVGVVAVGIAIATGTGATVSTVPVPLDTRVLTTDVAANPHDVASDTAYVHVVGGVTNPGLYRLELGARVVDAVMAAGGLAPDGSQCGINLARAIRDGEQIIVPQAPPGTPCQVASAATGGALSGTSGAPVSLSSATSTQLDALPGIGPALAQRIIDYREAHGGFSSVNDLTNVSGIGDKVLANIADLVTP